MVTTVPFRNYLIRVNTFHWIAATTFGPVQRCILEESKAIDASTTGMACFPCLNSIRWVVDASQIGELIEALSINAAIPSMITTDADAVNKKAVETNLPKKALILGTAHRVAISRFAANADSGVALNRNFGGMRGPWTKNANVDRWKPIESIARSRAGLPIFIDSVLEPVSGGRI